MKSIWVKAVLKSITKWEAVSAPSCHPCCHCLNLDIHFLPKYLLLDILLMRQGLRWFQSFGAGVGVGNGSTVFFSWLSWLLGWVNWLVGGLVNWLVSWLGLVGLLVGLVD